VIDRAARGESRRNITPREGAGYRKFRGGKIAYYRGAEDTLLTLRTVVD
jgi:hypothetical protein